MARVRLLYTLIFILTVRCLPGQIGGGSIAGFTLDPTGAGIAGAKVRAINEDTKVTQDTVTNSEGYFEFPLLPPGRYVLEAEHGGFQTGRSAEFSLNSGTRPRIDLRLSIGAVSEQVQVTATAPVVNTTTTDLGVVMTRERVESFPLNGRNYQNLVGLQSGVLAFPSTYTGQRGGMEFNGAPAFGVNLLLDGVDMSFGENSAPASDRGAVSNGGSKINTVSVDAIQEFKTTSSAFSAEYGRATSGVLNITTKSGTNKFHGTLFEFFRNDKLDANSYFSNLSGLNKPALRWNQFGGNLGGPIVREKLFFFFNYEGAEVRQASQVSGLVPTPALISQVTPAIQKHFAGLPTSFVPTSNPLVGLHRRNDREVDDEHTTLSRIDYIRARNQFAARYSYNHQDFSRPEGIRPANQRIFPTRFHNAVIQDGFTISPSAFNELRLGFNRTDVNRRNTTFDTEPAYLTVTDVGLTSDFQSRLAFLTNTYTLADNFSYVRGRHTWKSGFEIRDVRSSRVQATNPQHTYNTLADLIADKSSRVTINFGIPDRGFRTTNYGFFVQDEWRASRRMQINIGLRYEYYTPLTGAFNVSSSDPFGPMISKGQAMFEPDRNNWAPRLGVVFDVLGNQKLIVRAGGAIMFAPPQPSVYYNMSFIDPLIPFSAVFSPTDLPPDVSTAFPFPQSFADRIIADPTGLPKNVLLGRQVADYNRADEYSGQWNLSLQYAVTPTLAVQASYVGTRALKLYSVSPPNDPDPKIGRRPVPTIGEVLFTENSGRSKYHALQLAVNQRLHHGLSFDAYYTYAKSLIYFGVDQAYTAPAATVQDFSNISASNGPKESDLRHAFVSVFSYRVPSTGVVSRSTLGRFLLGGWNLQGIPAWRSGFPINVIAGRDLVGNSRPGGQRPDIRTDVSPYIKTGDRLLWLNSKAFDSATPLAQHRFGTLGMNAFRGPSGFSMDTSIHKGFQIRETQQITFRLELFNALNHKILSNPNATVSSPTFGQILGASGGRNIQLALKYNF